MRLRQIEVFQAIVEAGTISGAARILNVSQPNVSRVLNHTEQQLGFNLFERSSKGLIATKEGQLLLPEVEQLTQHLKIIDELTRSMHTKKAQTLRIGAAHACSQMIIAPTLVKYRKQNPTLNVDLVTEHFAALQQAVLNNELDIALVFGQQVDKALLTEPLFQENMVAILPKDMSAPKQVSLSWLCEHNFLMMQKNDPLGRVLHKAIDTLNLQPANSILIKTYSVIADMVLSGGGVGVVDRFTANRYSNEVNIVPISERLPFELILISRRDKPLSPQLLALKSLFKQHCRSNYLHKNL
ncbi:HTH-type transcriptional regulator GltR [Vibrio aerogenes CECT 7868]|uniref:HTH-type transcriptional regulator GltR n=1 Tax=Vibrio aerogenes CECT 7868 TaxID=1216006 RepID=A0A1M5Z496_9VIBR|nr:LysR family transcriptional regulator [Vibrio aerogenes]SHI18954.1 HTH-type transcriptional regulator GltR [Vibrio aerogenes CECT 7868]